jgi:hypothetical protein
MAVHRNFNWKKIAHSVIKKGKWKKFYIL